ncbi:MAG: hypothetical protein WB611_25985 [Stellaceae bacterium]
MSDNEHRPGRPMQAQLTEELQTLWSTYIDKQIASKVAGQITEMAEAIGAIIAAERQRVRAEIEAAIKVARLEIAVEILEARSATLESVSARLDRHFDSLLRTVSDGLTVKDDAGALLRRLPATSTRQ